MKKLNLWAMTAGKGSKDLAMIVDINEIIAVNTPDDTKPGFTVTLRCGSSISFPTHDGEARQEIYTFLWKAMGGK